MLWARTARASRAAVAKRTLPPTACYWIAAALENCFSAGCSVEQRQDMSKGKQLREGLIGACSTLTGLRKCCSSSSRNQRQTPLLRGNQGLWLGEVQQHHIRTLLHSF